MLQYFLRPLSNPIFYSCCLIALFLGACTSTNPPSNDWQRLHLNGKVKQFEEWTYSSYATFTNEQHNNRQTNWFSKEGFLNKGLFYQTDNQLRWTHYTYQSDSIWVRRTLQVDGGAEQNQNYWLYELNAQGQQKKLTSLLLDTSVFYRINVDFNEQQLPKTLIYSEKIDPTIVPCEVHRTYTEQGKVQEELVYVYDKANAQCSTQPTTSTYTYNEQGDIEREKVIYYNGKEEIYSYQYRYDQAGNWTNRLHYAGDKVIEVTKRQFFYYE
ncbi:MAG: hypothetical protein ACRBFS_03770 [Aureispira sp.]